MLPGDVVSYMHSARHTRQAGKGKNLGTTEPRQRRSHQGQQGELKMFLGFPNVPTDETVLWVGGQGFQRPAIGLIGKMQVANGVESRASLSAETSTLECSDIALPASTLATRPPESQDAPFPPELRYQHRPRSAPSRSSGSGCPPGERFQWPCQNRHCSNQ